MTTKSIVLYYTKGTSDKEYRIYLEPQLYGYIVYGLYGRRGKATRRDDKVKSPVPLSVAELVFDKVLDERRSSGYTTDISGTPFAGIGPAITTMSATPKLGTVESPPSFISLVSLSIDELEDYLDNDKWALQPLSVQDRLLLYREASGTVAMSSITSGNTPVPSNLKFPFVGIGLRVTLEGYIDVTTKNFVVMDGYTDVAPANKPFKDRWRELNSLFRKIKSFEFTSLYEDMDKPEACAALQDSGRAGVILRCLDSPYKGGILRNLEEATALVHHFNV